MVSKNTKGHGCVGLVEIAFFCIYAQTLHTGKNRFYATLSERWIRFCGTLLRIFKYDFCINISLRLFKCFGTMLRAHSGFAEFYRFNNLRFFSSLPFMLKPMKIWISMA